MATSRNRIVSDAIESIPMREIHAVVPNLPPNAAMRSVSQYRPTEVAGGSGEPLVAEGGGGGGRMAPRTRQRVRARPASNSRVHHYSGGRAHSPSEVNCFVKYSIFSFNILFFLLGFTLIGIGAWAQSEKENVLGQINKGIKFYLDPTALLFVIGFITFIIGFSGCIGSLRENTTVLSIYATLLGLLLLIEVAVVIYAFVWVDDLQTRLDNLLVELIDSYRDDPDLQGLIDILQQSFECCGIKSSEDWDNNVYFAKNAQFFSSPEAGGVPYSCCKEAFQVAEEKLINYACGHGARLDSVRSSNSSKIYEQGCREVIEGFIRSNILYVGIVLIVVAVIQMLGICFAQNLKSDILAQKAKWLNS